MFIKKGQQTSNKVKFQYASQQVKFAKKKLASGRFGGRVEEWRGGGV